MILSHISQDTPRHLLVVVVEGVGLWHTVQYPVQAVLYPLSSLHYSLVTQHTTDHENELVAVGEQTVNESYYYYACDYHVTFVALRSITTVWSSQSSGSLSEFLRNLMLCRNWCASYSHLYYYNIL